jgi:hypothetical protein
MAGVAALALMLMSGRRPMPAVLLPSHDAGQRELQPVRKLQQVLPER